MLVAYLAAAWCGLAAAFLLADIRPATAYARTPTSGQAPLADSLAAAERFQPAARGSVEVPELAEPAPGLPELPPRPAATPAPVTALGAVEPPRTFRPVVVVRAPAPAELEAIVRAAAAKWGAEAEQLLRIAWCESRYRTDAVNAKSGTLGLFQFMPATWRTWAPRAGLAADASPLDPVAASEVAAMMFATGQSKQWVCR